MTLFELPAPRELGGGWSLRFLTAGQMLECRNQGEAMAGEERDKALWANATLLARVLLKEGEPAFPDGEAVLASLTVGQMDGLTRRWWAQDDFSVRSIGEEQATQAEWATREGSENEHFDMARFLALGGAAELSRQDFAGEGFSDAGPSALSTFPGVWPGQKPGPGALPVPRGPYREAYREPDPYRGEGVAVPYGGGDLPEEIPAEASVSLASGRRIGGPEPIGVEQSSGKILLPEPARDRPGLTVEELDKTVERDARRYDGGLTLL